MTNFLIRYLGWQYRWFTVDPQAGTLSYYLCESTGDDSAQPVVGATPRWQVYNLQENAMVYLTMKTNDCSLKKTKKLFLLKQGTPGRCCCLSQ